MPYWVYSGMGFCRRLLSLLAMGLELSGILLPESFMISLPIRRVEKGNRNFQFEHISWRYHQLCYSDWAVSSRIHNGWGNSQKRRWARQHGIQDH